MKKTTVFLAILLTSLFVNAQITFEITLGGEDEDVGNSVIQTDDNGYILCGTTKSYGEGAEDVYVIKTDENGTVEWENTYGSSGQEFGQSIQPTNDDGYIICSKNHNTGSGPISLIKINQTGDLLWEKTYGTSMIHSGNFAEQTTDNGYIICGNRYTAVSQMYLMKTDVDGEMEWEKTFGGTSGDENAEIVHQTNDGGYILCGSTTSYGAGDKDIYLVRTDANGEFLWQNTIGGEDWDRGADLKITSDNGYVICGETVSIGQENANLYLVKTNQNGEMEWQQTYGGDASEEGSSVQQTNDNGYIICGRTSSYGNGSSDVYVVRTDGNGNLLWDKSFGGEEWDKGLSVEQTTENGYIITGYFGGYSGKAKMETTDVYLIRTDENGLVGIHDNKLNFSGIAFPNPSNGVYSIELKDETKNVLGIEVFNSNCQTIFKRNLENKMDKLIQIDLSEHSQGVYYLRVLYDKTSFIEKLIIL